MRFLKRLTILFVCSVQLSGCITAAVVGGAAVGTQMAADRRTTGIYIEDENIEIKAHRKLEQHLGEEAHVNVTSFNGIVLLAGEVPSETMKMKAETIIKTIPHIRNIFNELLVMEKTTLGDRSRDTLLTSKVKASFVKNYVGGGSSFNPSHVKIVTEHSVVYLMGLVTQSEGKMATHLARNTDGVHKVVKLFEYLP